MLQSITYNCLESEWRQHLPVFCGVAAHTVQRTGVHRGCNEVIQRYRGEQGCGKHLEFILGILVIMLSDITFFRVSVVVPASMVTILHSGGGRIYRSREKPAPTSYHSFLWRQWC